MLLTINSCFQGSPKSASEHKSSSWSQEKQLWSAGRKYTLLDGLAYNTCGYFVSCVVFTSNEQNVRPYYMLNHRIRGLSFHYKKNCHFAIGFYFLVRVFRNILIPSVRMTLTMSKMFALIICQTIEWEVDYFTTKENCYFGFYFLVRISKTSWFCQP